MSEKARGSLLCTLVDDFVAQKQDFLAKTQDGLISREAFLEEVRAHIAYYYELSGEQEETLSKEFEQYVFGYSVLAPLLEDEEITDIRVISFERVRIKRKGVRQSSTARFVDRTAYLQFVEYVMARNQSAIVDENGVQRFIDRDSHPAYEYRFTVFPNGEQPYVCIRKGPKRVSTMNLLVEAGMLLRMQAENLILRFRQGTTLIVGKGDSGKTTLLNALKETWPDDFSAAIIQRVPELTTKEHPDLMFFDHFPESEAGLYLDLDGLALGEIGKTEALPFLHATDRGTICAATIQAPTAEIALFRLVEYASQEGKMDEGALRMLQGVKTVVVLDQYRVQELYDFEGYDAEKQQMKLRRIVQ